MSRPAQEPDASRTTCLVIGGTGFIGSHLVEELRRERYDVTVYARPSSDTRLVEAAGAKVFRGDLRETERLKEALGGKQLVFWAGEIALAEPEYLEKTLAGLAAVVEAGQGPSGFRRIIFTSALTSLFPPDRTLIDEETRPKRRARDRYHIMKQESEALLAAADVPITIMRPFTVYGARSRFFYLLGDWLLKFEGTGLPFLGTADFIMPTIEATDLARAYLLAARKDEPRRQVYHLIDDGRITMGDMLAQTNALLGRKMRFRFLPLYVQKAMAAVSDHLGLLGNNMQVGPIIEIMSSKLTYSNERMKKELGVMLRYPTIKEGEANMTEWAKPLLMEKPAWRRYS